MQSDSVHLTVQCDRFGSASKCAIHRVSEADTGIFSSMELLLITIGYFSVLWWIAPHLATNGLIGCMKLLLVSFGLYFAWLSPTFIHRDSLADRGLGDWRTLFIRMDNFACAHPPYLVFTLGCAGIILGAALIRNPMLFFDFDWQALWLKLWLNLLNALGQDMLFLAFFIPRLKAIFPSTAGSGLFGHLCSNYRSILISLACALLFALYHLPNLPLVAMVFLLGFVLAQIYYHTPNLVLATLSHAIIGTLLHRVLEMHMRVGPFYWESDRYVYRTLFPALRELIGNAF